MNKLYDTHNEFFIIDQNNWEVKIAITDYQTALKDFSPMGIGIKSLYKEFKDKYKNDSSAICSILIEGNYAHKGFATRNSMFNLMKKHGLTND